MTSDDVAGTPNCGVVRRHRSFDQVNNDGFINVHIWYLRDLYVIINQISPYVNLPRRYLASFLVVVNHGLLAR